TAMRMMAEQYGGMPKLMLKKGMIDNFSNDPSVPIVDNSSVGWSAQYLQPTYNSPRGQELVDFMLSATKTHTGATETSTGELAKSSQMNATAIMMLQKASSVPLDQVKRRFKRTIEEVGEIWREFWTINYNTNRVIEIDNGQGQMINQAWRGTDFKDSGLKLKINVGASSDYSESLTMTTLDKLHDAKEIDTKTYIKLAPENIVPFKEELLKILDEQQASGMQQLSPEEQQTLSQLPPDKQAMVMQQLQGNTMNDQNNNNMMQGGNMNG
ncbi:MAG: hypothetical protein Q8936_24000, partial [Bacillota bacterium]|nr:hypothetical protein [Bacillota bacterium]